MSDQMLPYQPSLASTTGTRVDSACKHHHQCRVSTDDMLLMMNPQNSSEKLIGNPYRFCIHKDEMVVGIARPWKSDLVRKKGNNAYPRVISNLGMIDDQDPKTKVCRKMMTYMYHNCRNLNDKEFLLNVFTRGEFREPINEANKFFTALEERHIKEWLSIMYDHVPVGYAQTLGWAHPNEGDTMTTVMIGGLRTVMNGDFEVMTGDIIQWYWPFERDCFKTNGQRKPHVSVVAYETENMDADDYDTDFAYNISPYMVKDENWTAKPLHMESSSKSRESYHNKIFGQSQGNDKFVCRIKPYWKDDDHPRLYDYNRVFAVAISCARPHEMVDIKISKQSL